MTEEGGTASFSYRLLTVVDSAFGEASTVLSSAGRTSPGRTALAIISWMPKRAGGMFLSPRDNKALYTEGLIGLTLSPSKQAKK